MTDALMIIKEDGMAPSLSIPTPQKTPLVPPSSLYNRGTDKSCKAAHSQHGNVLK